MSFAFFVEMDLEGDGFGDADFVNALVCGIDIWMGRLMRDGQRPGAILNLAR